MESERGNPVQIASLGLDETTVSPNTVALGNSLPRSGRTSGPVEVPAIARTMAVFAGGMHLSDYLSGSVIALVYPREAVRAALRSHSRDNRRRRDLPAEVMVYYVIAMALFRTVSAREILRHLVDGLQWISPDLPVRVSGKSSNSRARCRPQRFATAAWRRWRIPARARRFGGRMFNELHAANLARSRSQQYPMSLAHLRKLLRTIRRLASALGDHAEIRSDAHWCLVGSVDARP